MLSLRNHPIFDLDPRPLGVDERVAIAYKRAQTILREYGLSASDVLNFSAKFWEMHLDPILPLDIGCFTILAAHLNLTVGTIARYLPERSDLEPLMKSLLNLETVGVYLLSERGHGLDAFNIETSATKCRDGFILHSPREEAAKYMPATTPSFEIPKVALVMARLIVDGEDRGSRFFIVPICSSTEMHRGVTSIRLPRRSGTSPLDFSLTMFDHVALPASALLGSSLEAPSSPREAWWNEVWRIPYGSMTVAAPCVQGLKHVAYIGARYSLHRHIVARGPAPVPIITFPTQQWAVLQAVAAGTILDTWYRTVIDTMTNPAIDPRVKHGMAMVVKATACRQAIHCTQLVSERCGAQGTFDNNFMTRFEVDARGIIIAEGDVMTLCIRLFSELLLGRYTLPMPEAHDSLLARLAHSILDEHVHALAALPGGHRSQDAEYLLLPQAERAVIAIGHCLAYAAASKAGVSQHLLDLYECGVARTYSAWFSEVAGISMAQQHDRETAALRAALPDLPLFVDALQVHEFVRASIISDDVWKDTVKCLPTYRKASAKHTDSQGRAARL